MGVMLALLRGRLIRAEVSNVTVNQFSVLAVPYLHSPPLFTHPTRKTLNASNKVTVQKRVIFMLPLIPDVCVCLLSGGSLYLGAGQPLFYGSGPLPRAAEKEK